MFKKIIIIFGFIILFTLTAPHSYAIVYDLIAPTGTLQRGGDAQFTVTIDTEGTTVTTGEIGINYDNTVLQYVSTSPGAAMNSIAVTPKDASNFLLTGTNSTGFSGSGNFALVNFKITASAPGSANVCSLWGPSETPTQAPTTPPGATSTPGVTNTPGPLTPTIKAPTALPKSGDNRALEQAGKAGGILVSVAIGLLVIAKVIL